MDYLVGGRMAFVVGDQERVLEPRDLYHGQLGAVRHALTIGEPSVLLEASNIWVASPPREEG